MGKKDSEKVEKTVESQLDSEREQTQEPEGKQASDQKQPTEQQRLSDQKQDLKVSDKLLIDAAYEISGSKLMEAVEDPEAMTESPFAFMLPLAGDDYGRCKLMWSPADSLFSKEELDNNLAPLLKLVKKLRKATKEEIILGITCGTDSDTEFGPTAKELVISMLYIKGSHFLDRVTSPLGSFAILALKRREGKGLTYGRPLIPISKEAMDRLGFTHCQSMTNKHGVLKVKWVQKSKIHFPPQKPEHYLRDTEGWEDAFKFWAAFYQGKIPGIDCWASPLLQNMLKGQRKNRKRKSSKQRPQTLSLYDGSDAGEPVPLQPMDEDDDYYDEDGSEGIVLDSRSMDLLNEFIDEELGLEAALNDRPEEGPAATDTAEDDALGVTLLSADELSDVWEKLRSPKKVLHGEDAIKYLQDAVDGVLFDYESDPHYHEFVIRRKKTSKKASL